MSVKQITEGLVAKTEDVVIDYNGKPVKFVAKEVGYLTSVNIALRGDKGENAFALLVAQSIHDEQGNKFTYEEVLSLKQEIAEKFLNAALSVNGRLDAEKK